MIAAPKTSPATLTAPAMAGPMPNSNFEPAAEDELEPELVWVLAPDALLIAEDSLLDAPDAAEEASEAAEEPADEMTEAADESAEESVLEEDALLEVTVDVEVDCARTVVVVNVGWQKSTSALRLEETITHLGCSQKRERR